MKPLSCQVSPFKSWDLQTPFSQNMVSTVCHWRPHQPCTFFSLPHSWLQQHGGCTNLCIGNNTGTI